MALTKEQKAAAIKKYSGVIRKSVQKALEFASRPPEQQARPMRKSARGVEVTQDEADKTRFSLAKLLRGMAYDGKPGAWDGADRERKSYEKRYFLKSTMHGGSAQAGGYLVPDQVTNELIELLREQAVARRIGMRVVPMTRQKLTMRKVATGSTTAWGAEATTLAEQTAPTFGAIQLDVKKLFCRFPVSSELIADADLSVESIVREDIAAEMALAEDQAFFLGSGIGDVPLGLVNVAGTNSIAGVTLGNLTETKLRAMNLAIRNANARPTAWLMTPTIWDTIQQFQTSVTTSGGGTRLVQPDLNNPGQMRLLGYPVFDNSEILSGTDEYIFLGAWNQALIGQRMSIEFATDRSVNFNSDEVMIRAIARVDFAVRQPAAFAKCTIDNS